jgi:ubiquinone biosynthesis protein
MRIPSIPQYYRNLNRAREIFTTLSKYGLADWVSRYDLPIARGLLKNRNGEILSRHTREERVRMAAEELGPTFIKLGQILSTRPDVVGVALADALKQLQSNVPADPPEVARETIQRELGQPVEDLFAEFDDLPLASASIGQVHRARLRSGELVVIKVQHQGIEHRIRVDLDILSGIAQFLESNVPELENYRPRATIAEFQRLLRRELDFTREERNLQQFARDFEDDPTIHVPRTYPELSTSRVLTMELLEGVKLTEPERLHGGCYDLDEIARRGATLYLEMIFRNGVYHADPHPGNIVVMDGNVIGLLDFGMVGRIDETLREEFEEMLMSIVSHDSERLTSVIMRIGSVPAGFDEMSLSIDMSEFVAHYGNQPLEDIDLGTALRDMIEIIRRYRIMLAAPVAMLLKVLIMLEGTAKLLNPKFSLMGVMEPYHRKMLLRRMSPARHFRKMRRIASEMEQLAELLPRRLREILQQVQSGKFDVHLDHRGLEPSVNRLALGMLASALFLGSSLLLSQRVWPVYGVSVPGTLGCIASLFLSWRLLRAINKTGHLERRH